MLSVLKHQKRNLKIFLITPNAGRPKFENIGQKPIKDLRGNEYYSIIRRKSVSKNYGSIQEE
jgi:hypothetical protein